MPQQSPSSLSPGFTPRKEFIREQKPTPNSFAILAIASSSFVRLYSFPQSVITALRALFDDSASLATFREDLQHHFFEFSLTGKPWASPKNLRAEKLLVDIIAVVYMCGYIYVSNLDYGRENDDRIVMAFSKPSTPASRPTTPHPPFRGSSSSIPSDKPTSRRTPFALSFLSPTLMRVISPPLHLTPAILQAVRASWPRGVVSEKKIGDNSFEFKLKGYKWFQEDTFATDSLRQILSLLTSLDSYAFTLLSSISLTNRSRMKDLWVFTGPGSDHVDDPLHQDSTVSSSTRNDTHADTSRGPTSQTVGPSVPSPSPPLQHRRFASEPIESHHNLQHARVAAETVNPQHFSLSRGYRVEHTSMGPALLRKPAPRAQVPVSVVHEIDPPESEGIRAYLPSTISSGIEDMTGVGAKPEVIYGSAPYDTSDKSPAAVTMAAPQAQSTTPPKARSVSPPNRTRSPLKPVATRQKTPPLLSSNLNSSTSASRRSRQNTGTGLLGPGAFRDSALSNTSEASFDIPIQWSGIAGAIVQKKDKSQEPHSGHASHRRSSAGPMLPGGWQPTPVEEKPETETGIALAGKSEDVGLQHEDGGIKTPIQEVASRVASPEFTRPDMPLRKSEAALVGLIREKSPPALPLPYGVNGGDNVNSTKGQGWVLVNVGGSTNSSQVGLGEPVRSTKEHLQPSPEAKAIVIVDALDSKNKSKNKSNSPLKKHLFNLGRKSSVKASVDTMPTESSLESRPSLRKKLKAKNTPEALKK
ncbi:hypothetical protein H0H92_014134 [Tricholoma furcatifolium]|nr:hypothetical protein H0H92_014134 [Tricholoma furcatifolium]